MLTLQSLDSPLDVRSELALDALLRAECHAWGAGAESPAARAGAARSRAALSRCPAAFVVSDGAPIAVGRTGRADWDSEHFGREMHRFDDLAVSRRADRDTRERASVALVRALLESAASADMILARVTFDADALIRALEDAGFRAFDAQTTWTGPAPSSSPVPEARVRVRSGRADDAVALAGIAASAMSEVPSHLHADCALGRTAVDALYAEWGRNSVLSGLADHVAVAEVDGAVAGFATAKLQDAQAEANARIGVIPLVAVDARHRGMGVARAVVGSALRWLGEQGVATCAVGTQVNNIPAARLYAGLGLRPALTAVNLHRSRLAGAT